MKENICPLCGRDDCERMPITGNDWEYDMEGFYLNCKRGYSCTIHSTVFRGKKEEVMKRLHVIYLFMKKHPVLQWNGISYKYKFFYEMSSVGQDIADKQKVNVANLMRNYPKSFMETMDKALLNLKEAYPRFGQLFDAEIEMVHLLYASSWERKIMQQEIPGILDILVELKYLETQSDGVYKISAEGWKRISNMEHKDVVNQGFMAMAFREETAGISNVFKEVILKCGYEPRRIDEKEHNRQIVPEILFEISRSKFVVVDITYPNYGAYYEAGYAEALGKEVIICCREEEFLGKNKPHFDIAQKSTVVWKDEKELEERLYKRIEATVGLNI